MPEKSPSLGSRTACATALAARTICHPGPRRPGVGGAGCSRTATSCQEVHQGRGRRDRRRPLLRPARRHAALHGPGLVVRPAVFDDGLNFDGSSIRGFQAIHESDMSLFPTRPRRTSTRSARDKTLVVNFFIHDPLTGEAYSRDPRNIARKARPTSRRTGIGDTAYFAPEAEFYVFDNVRFETKANAGFYHIDSEAGAWNTGPPRTTTAATRSATRAATSRSPPVDHFGDLRDEMVTRAGEVRPPRRARSTTRSAPPARRRSTTSSTSCSRPPTT